MPRNSRRKGRQERRSDAASAAPSTSRAISRPVTSREPVAGRNTFKTAQAQRKAAQNLGGILYQPKPRKAARTAPAPISKAPKKVAGSTSTSKGKTPERADLSLTTPPTCKKRPTRNKGNGAGRPFVPWCK